MDENPTVVAVAEREERCNRKLRLRLFRSVTDLDEVRSVWQTWCQNPNADMDFYRLLMARDSKILSPYVIGLYRDDVPESMVIGRIIHERIEFKIGYSRLWANRARVLNILYGGVFGRLSSEGAEAVVAALLNALRSDEADLVSLNSIPVDSPLYRAAAGVPPLLCRDFLHAAQAHWKMGLTAASPLGEASHSKDLRESRRKMRKLFADYPNRVAIRCLGKVQDLPRILSDVEEVARKTYQRGRGCLRRTEKSSWPGR